MSVVEGATLDRIRALHASGARILLRRINGGGIIKIRKGPFRLFVERLTVDTQTYEAVKRIVMG